jgi:hypothetical protein
MTATIGATVVWELLGPEYGLMLATPFMVAAVVVMARGYARSPAVGRTVTAVVVTVLVAALAVLLVLLLAASGAVRGYG